MQFGIYCDEMRGFFLTLIIAAVGLMCIGNAHAATADTVGTPPRSEQQMLDIEKKDEPPDNIQKQFIARLKSINADLQNKHSALAKNYRLATTNQQKMNRDLRWGYGQISWAVMKSLQDLAAERSALEASVNKLEKQKEELRSEVLSSYDGKVPEWLTRQWDKEEKAYRDYVEGVYLQVQWSMESPKWKGEEKVFRDYMQEYYRLRQ
jgi:hypothetical protein